VGAHRAAEEVAANSPPRLGGALRGLPQRRLGHAHRLSSRWDRSSRLLVCDINQAGIESPLDEKEVSYFLSTIELRRGDTPGMSRWRKNLFLATAHLTADAADHFRLPRDRTVIMGSRIEF